METINLAVTDPIIVNSSMQKHVKYLIKGYDSGGAFEQYRRYKEFLHLRQILSKNWPGCFIPKLPPKMYKDNFESVSIERRRKLLSLFLTKASSCLFMYNSEPFQTFIRVEGDFLRIPLEKQMRIAKIYQEYTQVFNEFFDSSIIGVDQLPIAQEAFEVSLQQLRTFKDRCKNTREAFEKYKGNKNYLYAELNSILKKDFGEFDPETNPFNLLVDWVHAEELDLQAFIECILQKYELEALFQKISDRKIKEILTLGRLQSGKRKWTAIFKKNNIQDDIEQCEKSIQEIEKEAEMLQTIIQIITARLIHQEIDKFREKFLVKYEKALRNFAIISMKEFEGIQNNALNFNNKPIGI